MPRPVLRTDGGVPGDAPVRADRRAQTADALLPALTVTAVVLGLLALANLPLVPQPGSVVTVTVAGTLALLVGLGRWACGLRRGRALVAAHPDEVGLVACLLTSLFPLSQLLLHADPLASGGLLVFLLTTGTLLNAPRHSRLVTGVCLLQWLVAAAVHGTLLAWAGVGVLLLCSAVLARRLNAVRSRSADRWAAAEAAVVAAASSDELTGLANRRGLLAAAGRLVPQGAPGASLTAFFIDVDGLKQVNDRHGHAAGDQLLLGAAAALRAATRPGDVVARLGGDEFAVLLPATPAGRSDRARHRVEEALARAGVAASLGWARAEPGEDVEHLLGRADAAMYAVKQSRRAPGQPAGQPDAAAVPALPPARTGADHRSAGAPRAQTAPAADRAGTDGTHADLRDLVRACAWLHLAVAPAHLLLLDPPAARTVAVVSLAVAAVFAVLVLVDLLPATGPLVARHASGLLCAGLVLVCAEMVLFGAVVAAPWASLPVVLVVVVTGGALRSRWQVATVCLVTVAAWALVTVAQGVPPGWLWDAMTLGCALGAAAMLHVARHRTVQRMAAAQARVRAVALTDELTGLPNRRAFLADARAVVDVTLGHGDDAGVLFLDLDGLKRVNDLQGHAAGDRLLVAAADVLRTCSGPRDIVARLAGDEFTVLLPGCPPEEVSARAQRLATSLARADVSASIGAAHLPGDASSLEELLARADEDMLRIKAGRRVVAPQALPVG